jgi:hypothetical protein
MKVPIGQPIAGGNERGIAGDERQHRFGRFPDLMRVEGNDHIVLLPS